MKPCGTLFFRIGYSLWRTLHRKAMDKGKADGDIVDRAYRVAGNLDGRGAASYFEVELNLDSVETKCRSSIRAD